MTDYFYTISVDVIAGKIDSPKLSAELENQNVNITPVFQGLCQSGDTLKVVFDGDLIGTEKVDFIDPTILNHNPVDRRADTKVKYAVRSLDGSDYYNGWRSGLRIDVEDLVITESEAMDCEMYLLDMKSNLITGDWITARACVDMMSLSGIFDQTMKDLLLSDMDTYIAGSY